MNKLHLSLYITGRTIRSDAAIENLHAVLCGLTAEKFELTVIDVLEDPQAADESFILATPTLVKHKPLPTRKIIGDLSDIKLLKNSLNLT